MSLEFSVAVLEATSPAFRLQEENEYKPTFCTMPSSELNVSLQ